MSTPTSRSDTSRRKPAGAAAVAGRLRLLQAELADEPPEMRQQLLSEELDRVLGGMTSGERASFLSSLDSMFPTWDSRVDTSKNAAPEAARSMTDKRELRDPSFLISRLIEASTSMSGDERREAIARLAEAGLAPAGRIEWPAQADRALRAQLKVDKDRPMDPARILELETLLANLAASLDQVSRLAWKELSPRSPVRMTQDLARTMSQFVQGDGEVGRSQLQQDVESLRSLIAALIQAVGHAGREFAQSFRKFAPAEIEAQAKLDKKFMETTEAACWRKYRDIAADLDESTVDARVRQIIAAYAESFLGHRRASAPH